MQKQDLFVVIQNGVKISEALPEAEAKALCESKNKKLVESKDEKAPRFEIKQLILG
jgi:hypothetical protein